MLTSSLTEMLLLLCCMPVLAGLARVAYGGGE